MTEAPPEKPPSAKVHFVWAIVLFGTGLAVQTFFAPTVVIHAVRSAAGVVSCDIATYAAWDLVRTRISRLDGLRAVRVDLLKAGDRGTSRSTSFSTNAQLVLVAATGEHRTQWVGEPAPVEGAGKRLEGFLADSTADTMTVTFRGAKAFRYFGAVFLALGLLSLSNVPWALWKAARMRRAAAAAPTS